MTNENELTLLIQENFKQLYQYLDIKFKEINERLDRIDVNSNEDIIAMLKQIDKNTKNLSKDIEYSAEQVGKHERGL
jgi:hypothetical protein